MARVDNHFASVLTSPIFNVTIRGVERMYSITNPTNGVKKLAFTLELVKHLDGALGPVFFNSPDLPRETRRRGRL
jgi:hypothetical protein